MDSAFAKLSWAKLHFESLESEVFAFRAGDPHAWTYQVADHIFDPSLAVVRVIVHVKEETPDHWGLIVGDILTNLRAAFDHAVYGHAAARTQLTASQERALQYPMVDDAKAWPGKQQQLAQLIDPAVLQVIEDSQPFKLQPDPKRHAFALMNGLANRDKHRAVRLVTYVSEQLKVACTDLDVVQLDVNRQPMTDQAVVATATVRRSLRPPGAPPSDVPMRFHTEHAYVENIDLPTVGQQRPVLDVMRKFVDIVRDTLNRLKAAGC